MLSLVEPLSNGRTHAVVVTAEDRSILGIVTQTDLVAVLTRLVSNKAFRSAHAARGVIRGSGEHGPIVAWRGCFPLTVPARVRADARHAASSPPAST